MSVLNRIQGGEPLLTMSELKSWHPIKRVAVLGAGVMGAQIAAHCVNAGLEVILFDLGTTPQKKNLLAMDAIRGLTNLKPDPLLDPTWVKFIQPANYEDDLERLKTCDLIIEAIAERLDWKLDLYQKIKSFCHDKAILASNTSGLSISALAKPLPQSLRSRFLGVHFFNPPRYMSLVELVPHAETDPEVLNGLETFLTLYLGKNIVRAQDTPNFIGNRIGIFSLLNALYHADKLDLRLDVVDALTGPLIGHPKSATLRTLDIVGLDTFAHVVRTMYTELPDDPWRELFVIPSWMKTLIDRGCLGQKAGLGIYKKEGKDLYVYDIKEEEYRPMTSQANKDVVDIMKTPDPEQRYKRLYDSGKADGKFLWACQRDVWHYCAYHLESIAHTVRDVDEAMRWGFAWALGPFESWQEAGWSAQVKHLETDIKNNTAWCAAPLPAWVQDLKSGCYQGRESYAPAEQTFLLKRALPIYEQRLFVDTPLIRADRGETLFENNYVRLWRQADDIGILSFRSKMATISRGVLDGIRQALALAERSCSAMVIWQSDYPFFSVGADVKEFLASMETGDFALIDETLQSFQAMCLSLRYSPIPVVAAIRGYAFGGACELALHCDARVAHVESNIGLVEAAIGLLPGGGGLKEMARLAALRAGQNSDGKDLMLFLKPIFENIAAGKASLNAHDAKTLGYLQPQDTIIMHADELLYVAKQTARHLLNTHYVAPRPDLIRVAGDEGFAQCEGLLINLLEGDFISEHDYLVANTIAQIICGGMVDANSKVDEAWILRLEREGFIELAQTPQTRARVEHMLATGKALRN